MPSTHLLIWVDIPPEHEAGFNEWYNREHAPDRVLRMPGFIQARRFVAVEGQPGYAALYEVKGPEVFQNEAYLAMRRSPDPNSRKFIPHFRNAIRFMGPAIADAVAVKGIAEGAWARIAAFKCARQSAEEARQWAGVAAALVGRAGIVRARVFQTAAEVLEGAVRNMRGHDRERMRAPDRLADLLVMVEATTERQAIDIEKDLTGAIHVHPGLTLLDSARVQQLVRIARTPENRE